LKAIVQRAAARGVQLTVRDSRLIGKAGEKLLKEVFGGAPKSINTKNGWRFIDNFVRGIAQESKIGRVTLTSRIRQQIAKDMDLLQTVGNGVKSIEWHFFPGPSGSGMSPAVRKVLRNAGIKIIEWVF
jgi:hypothetical protein